ncbi:sigma-54-dependent Fis family transcriptional regulator [Dongia sedimenti]|uniref:Sigma-54-dependent Fis family transcriptional regulator n=1 Tax=Dongia sedimenti TaxID=3064282 RepID=A0ABU0YG76_9PROT|nr:sigma-54-dependent Fis family transcriptional regulator [Rhodospirillaceae bacterium R-7]
MVLLRSEIATSAPDRGLVDLQESWRRCAERYRFDRAAKPYFSSLTAHEIGEHSEGFDENLVTIDDELKFIQSTLRSARFCVSFSNMAGIILRYQTGPGNDAGLEMERPGAIWAEGVAGTNGVGTCIMEHRPTIVAGEDHYFQAYSSLSCVAVPVLSADAEMAGVLNIATSNPKVGMESLGIVAGLALTTAERLSNRLFMNRFSRNSILRVQRESHVMLLALDEDQRIIGANREARAFYRLGADGLGQHELWSIFERSPDTLDGMTKGGTLPRLRQIDGTEAANAVLVPPEEDRAWRRPTRKAGPARDNRTAGRTPRLATHPTIEQCLGSDPRMAQLSRLLRNVSGSLPLLLLGETGTGKDTLARALHNDGARRDKPFVAFNCAAVPESLIDSELFGYSAGAFTGAKRDGNTGRLREADGGTLFLDEIGDMPLALQTRLLRVLESGEVSPLGSGKAQHIDVNIIAATNHDLLKSVAERRFRQDLYFRLAGLVVEMQPLRERSDILEIAQSLLRASGSPAELGDDATAALRRYCWPGNIRELRFVLLRAVHICEGNLIKAQDLCLPSTAGQDAQELAPPGLRDPREPLRAAEKQMIQEMLALHSSDVTKAARALNMGRATLYRKMRQHALGSYKVIR